ncbi:hypothetical protein GY45DRAFT_651537 [Cubamyces sp. BRFM 1775]|nr:hypothetical protein GY45DRAFT_651537 [Cubamyces sp. BRFM 1775]
MSSSTNTPVPKAIDASVILENLGAMRTTNNMFISALSGLQDCGKQVKEMCPTLEGASEQIHDLGNKVDAQDDLVAKQMGEIREKVNDDYKSDALARMKEHFQGLIKSEVKRQVKVQMDAQMYPTHLARPLQEEIAEGRAQVIAMDAALRNSQARRENADVVWENPEPLMPIVRNDGEISSVWPTDANSLMAYDDATMAQLLQDYDLHDHGDRTKNFNRFMAFIGSPMRHAFLPTAGDAPIGSRGS